MRYTLNVNIDLGLGQGYYRDVLGLGLNANLSVLILLIAYLTSKPSLLTEQPYQKWEIKYCGTCLIFVIKKNSNEYKNII